MTCTFLKRYQQCTCASLPGRRLCRVVGNAALPGRCKHCVSSDFRAHSMQLFLVLCAIACGSSKTIAYINIIPPNLQCRSLDPCTDTSDCKAGVWNRHCRAAFMKHVLPRFSRPAPIIFNKPKVTAAALRVRPHKCRYSCQFGHTRLTCMHAVGGSRVLIHNGRSSLFDLCPCITWQRSSG